MNPLLALHRIRELEAERQSELAKQYAPDFVHDEKHPLQTAFVLDESRRKAALCTRRAGKSVADAKILIQGGLLDTDPNGESLYVAGSKSEARGILVPSLDRLSRAYNLGLRMREIDNQLFCQLPNGHKIWLAGCSDLSEMKKFRGRPFARVVVDEAQNYAFLDELVQAVLQPCLIDKRGQLILSGTPSPVPAGLFYEATTGDGGPMWITHSWSILDNPYIPGASEELAEYRKAYGWTEDHPTYRREWLGQWVRDAGALVYPFSANLNASFQDFPDARRLELPPGEYTYGLGVDVGFIDSTAFVVGAIRKGHPEIYILEAYKKPGLIPSAVAGHIESIRHREEWRGKLHLVVVDEGGAGKGYAEEIRQSFGIGCQPADKQRKRAYQELVAGDLLSAVIRIHPYNARPLIQELQILQWNPERTAEDERFENHLADAFLYVCRALKPWYRPELEAPKPNTPEWWEAQRQKMRREAEQRVLKRARAGNRWR